MQQRRVNPPAVSYQLRAFEERLGTPLFLRSTRSVTLTDAGRSLYESSRHLLGGLGDALDRARDTRRARAGRLRITLPHRAWQLIIAPRLAVFQTEYPNIELELMIEEGLTDIIARGVHAGVRLGDYLQEDMIAVRLSRSEEAAYVAAPDYLQSRGVPARPEDLMDHVCIRHRQISSGQVTDWRFSGSSGDTMVAVKGGLIMNDLRTVVDAASRGLGIGWSLRRAVQAELDKGTLVQILADFTPARPGFFLYFPRSFQQLGILRGFVEHFTDLRT